LLRNVCFNEKNQWLAFEYEDKKSNWLGVILSFSKKEQGVLSPFPKKQFCEILNTASKRYGGKSTKKANKKGQELLIPAWSAIVYTCENKCSSGC
jgi:hypothetical protein